MKCRVVRYPGGYRVEEIVTSDGHYITWPDLFATIEAAKKAILRECRGNVSVEIATALGTGQPAP